VLQLIPTVLKVITNGKVPNKKASDGFIYFFHNYIPGTFFKLLLFCISINEGNPHTPPPPPHDDNFWKSLNDICNDHF
jgi:hypothetical protein